MSTLPEESVYSRPVFLHRGHSLTCWQDFELFCNFGDVWFFCSLLSTTLHLPELEIPGLCYSRHSVMGNRKQIQYLEISKTYPLMGKFICVIICIAICLISWICNSWIRILAGCLLCTAHCLWFPAYLQAFLSYCLLLLVFVVTRECGSPGLQHGPLRAPKTFQSLSKPSKTFQNLWTPFKHVQILTKPIKTFEFLILWI